VEQHIAFCTTSDGVSIAYATLGSGPPLVYACGMPGNLALEWETPVSREFLQALAEGFTLIRYDMRGSGLSDRDASDLSLGALTRDLEAVTDSLQLDRFALLSLGFLAGPIAMTYAAAHTDRVTHLILSQPFLRGGEITTSERQHAIVEYVAAFGMIISIADLERDQVPADKAREARDVHRLSASPAVSAAALRTMFSADVTPLVDRLSMPALVFHGRDDHVIPFALGRELAARLPHARFVPLEGTTAAPWVQTNFLIPEIQRFLGVEIEARRPQAAVPSGLVTILLTDMEGSTTLTQRLGDTKAQELLRAHNTLVRDALRSHGGSETKHTGDGIMASFPSASRALECAIAIQRAFASHNEGLLRQAQDAQDTQAEPVEAPPVEAPPVEMRVRIGLNAGEPIAEEQDLFGTAVQLAARVCAKAEPGQILASDVVRQLAAGKGFLFADVGQVALRGFEDPVRLHEVRWQE
jgi:class 3 adenylate cyclase/pimeloyl-ACP methyl ester carboxylesterase